MSDVSPTSTEAAYHGHSMHAAADDGDLRSALAAVLNSHSRDNGSNTPDFILAQYLTNCLDAFDIAVQKRAQWFGRMDTIGGSLPYATIPHDGTPDDPAKASF